MGKVNPEGMARVEALRLSRVETLRQLTAKPFTLHDEAQVNALKKYMDEFELYTNQMYLYQAVSTGMVAWLGTSIVARFLPIPEFVSSLFAVALYLGVSAFILKSFSMANYNQHRNEMRMLYNWCLKNNREEYNPAIDNSEKLQSGLMQDFIRLLAPVCSIDDMIVWKTEPNEASRSSWSNTLNAGYSAVVSTFSIFSPTPVQTTLEQHRLKELKELVQNGSLQRDTLPGFKHAIEYFTSNTKFRELITEQFKNPKPILQELIPSMIMDTLAAKFA